MGKDEFYKRHLQSDSEEESTPPPAAVDPAFSKLIAERAAWESQDIDEYYISILHRVDDAAEYTQKISVKQGIPEYLTGYVSILPFSFLHTIEEIYQAVESTFDANQSATIMYDLTTHTPAYVAFKNYLDSGKDYTLEIDFRLSIREEDLPAAVDPYLAGVNLADFNMDLFLQEKSAWEGQNLQVYWFVICEYNPASAAPLVEISVSRGGAHQLTPAANFAYNKTISELYADIEDEIKKLQAEVKAEGPKYPYRIAIEYSERLHYPTYYYVVIGEPEDMLDGNIKGFEISTFDLGDG
jgi:hypothetical protein